jgi:hypothetical protein
MLVNELAQWAAIVFLAIVGFGLTRQLGQFLVSRKEQLEYEGPDVAKVLPVGLFTAAEFAQVQELATLSPSGVTAVVAMSDNCPGCVQAVQALETEGSPDGVPLVAVLASASEDFNRRVQRAFNVVSLDSGHKRAHEAGIRATPFILLVDRDLRVLTKAISADVPQVVEQWRSDRRRADEAITPAANGAGSAGKRRRRKETHV